MILPRPRAYVDWTVPRDERGNEIGDCDDPETYRRYLEWLADYLYCADIPIPENQQSLLAEFEAEGGIHGAVFWTSEDWGISIWDLDIVQEEILAGTTYEQFHAHQVKVLNEMPEEDRQIDGEPEEEFFISEADYNRIGLEMLEEKRVPRHINHADVAYRAIFAKLLKSVESREERIAHLDYFYRNFNDCASK